MLALVTLLLMVSALPTSLRAAISVSVLLEEASTENAQTYNTTGTFSVPSNHLGICVVGVSETLGETVSDISISGPMASWDVLDTTNADQLFDSIATPAKRIKAFRTLGTGAVASALTITVNSGTGNQTGVLVVCYAFADVDTSGLNGAGAIIQAKDGANDNNATLSVTLDNPRTANSALIFFGANAAGCAYTPEAGYTTGTETFYSTPTHEILAEWMIGGTDTTPQFTLAGCGTPTWAGIAVEVKMSGSGGPGLLLGVG
jgi:hypothetical protein